jgi:hypothetical protein
MMSTNDLDDRLWLLQLQLRLPHPSLTDMESLKPGLQPWGYFWGNWLFPSPFCVPQP